MEPVSTPPPVAAPTPARGIFGTNIPGSVAAVIAFLLFLLPFAELRCTSGASQNSLFSANTGTMANNSGMGLALGLGWKTAFDKFGGDMGVDTRKSLNNNQDPNYYALIAWVMALAAAAFSISKWKWAGQLALVSAVLGLAALVGLFIDLKQAVKDVPSGGNTGTAVDSYTDVQMELVFTPWFYAAAVLLLATIYFSYRRMNQPG